MVSFDLPLPKKETRNQGMKTHHWECGFFLCILSHMISQSPGCPGIHHVANYVLELLIILFLSPQYAIWVCAT